VSRPGSGARGLTLLQALAGALLVGKAKLEEDVIRDVRATTGVERKRVLDALRYLEAHDMAMLLEVGGARWWQQRAPGEVP
jgi:hypothetical protein